jgi:hypothetical protein
MDVKITQTNINLLKFQEDLGCMTKQLRSKFCIRYINFFNQKKDTLRCPFNYLDALFTATSTRITTDTFSVTATVSFNERV